MESLAEDLIANSLAASTRKSYAVGQSEFTKFCTQLGVPALPTQEQILILFVADLSQQLSPSSVRSYLSAICHMHISQGFGDPLSNALRLQLALKGLRRTKPSSKDSRLPVTPYILRRVKAVLSQSPHNFNNIMLWAVCCLGFLAFLRSGEMTVPTGHSFDPSWHLTPKDIAVDNPQQPTYIQVLIKGSKTDQMCQGVRLYVGMTNNDLCPVSAVLTYLVCRGIDDGPLFCTEDGQPIT